MRHSPKEIAKKLLPPPREVGLAGPLLVLFGIPTFMVLVLVGAGIVAGRVVDAAFAALPGDAGVPYAERVDPFDLTEANPDSDDGCWTVSFGKICFDKGESVPATPPAELPPRVLAECGPDLPCTNDRKCVEGWCEECGYSSDCSGDLVCRENKCVSPEDETPPQAP